MKAPADTIVLELFPNLATLCASTTSSCFSCISFLLLACGRFRYNVEQFKTKANPLPLDCCLGINEEAISDTNQAAPREMKSQRRIASSKNSCKHQAVRETRTSSRVVHLPRSDHKGSIAAHLLLF